MIGHQVETGLLIASQGGQYLLFATESLPLAVTWPWKANCGEISGLGSRFASW